MSEVWFVIPSANPENCRKVLPLWRAQGYRIAVLQNRERAEIPADRTVWFDSYPGWPESVNILCRTIIPESCNLIVSGGDDMLPDPSHSASQLAEQFFERFPDGFGVMQPHGDEFMCAKRYCGSPFIGRGWFERMYGGDGPMYKGYHHNYADNELYWLAKGFGALWERPDLSHYHDHFTRDGREQPAYWESVKERDLRDCLLYYSRVHENFPGHRPTRGPGAERAYDTTLPRDEMLTLADQRLFSVACDNPYARAIAGGLQRCADAGHERVAIYGCGLHTQAGIAALREPPVRVCCFIDDNAANHGRSMWGVPVVSREGALALGVEAVVLSGNSVEDRLWANSAIFRERGVTVVRLYERAQSGTECAAARRGLIPV